MYVFPSPPDQGTATLRAGRRAGRVLHGPAGPGPRLRLPHPAPPPAGLGHGQRAGHGLYRLTASPITEHEPLAGLTLWSRTRAGEAQAVVSHDTALTFYGVSDLLPKQIHLTVPPGFRKPAPAGVVLHVATLTRAEIETRHGFQVTTLERTLLDLAGEGRHADLLEQAIEVAAAQGAISEATAARLKGRG